MTRVTSTAYHTQQTEEAERTREGEGAAPPPGPDAGSGAWDDGLIARRAAGATGGGQPPVPLLPAPTPAGPRPDRTAPTTTSRPASTPCAN